MHKIVFVEAGSRNAGSPQAISDARHLAQAALARASGYVTSDGQMLAARDKLFRQIGIDVASLDEFVALLPADSSLPDRAQLRGTDCASKTVSIDLVRRYLEGQRVTEAIAREFTPDIPNVGQWRGQGIVEAGEIVAVGVCMTPSSIDAATRALVHVRPDHVSCEVFADYLVDSQCHEACRSGPATIELPHIPGQSIVRRAAILRGFLPLPRVDTLIKVALGRPVTLGSWTEIARQTRRKTGLRLPEAPPGPVAVQFGLDVEGPDRQRFIVRLPALESALSPTILAWPGREAVIVPIARSYADELLGTSNQLPLFGNPEAAFLTRRTYFNSPRMAALMRPGLPILFYESIRSGGRGAIVAAARIVDATVVAKQQVPDDLLRRAVVEDLDPLSSSVDVLATTFDDLLRLPSPVSLEVLRAIGAAGPANLQTTTAVASQELGTILELGWSRG